MIVVGKSGNRYLLSIDDDVTRAWSNATSKGRVLDLEKNTLGPPWNLNSTFMMGYFEPFELPKDELDTWLIGVTVKEFHDPVNPSTRSQPFSSLVK